LLHNDWPALHYITSYNGLYNGFFKTLLLTLSKNIFQSRLVKGANISTMYIATHQDYSVASASQYCRLRASGKLVYETLFGNDERHQASHVCLTLKQ